MFLYQPDKSLVRSLLCPQSHRGDLQRICTHFARLHAFRRAVAERELGLCDFSVREGRRPYHDGIRRAVDDIIERWEWSI